jgi:hypothetical protein
MEPHKNKIDLNKLNTLWSSNLSNTNLMAKKEQKITREQCRLKTHTPKCVVEFSLKCDLYPIRLELKWI